MPKLALYNQTGAQIGDIELSDAVFGIEPNEHVLHQVVVMQLASLRQGTHSTKTRGEVSGGGAKPWRQKGTGRARQGSIRAPHWVGGGTVFGPKPRSYKYKLPKKVRRLALKSALSSKVKANEMIVVDDLQIEKPKTKEMVAILANLSAEGKTLIVTGDYNETVTLSARNIPGVKTIEARQVNVLDVLKYDKMIMTKGAVERVEEVLA